MNITPCVSLSCQTITGLYVEKHVSSSGAIMSSMAYRPISNIHSFWTIKPEYRWTGISWHFQFKKPLSLLTCNWCWRLPLSSIVLSFVDPLHWKDVRTRKRVSGHTWISCKYICFIVRVQLKCDGTRWRTGGEVKGKLANGVGSQYPLPYPWTWCIEHYYRWCAQLGYQ